MLVTGTYRRERAVEYARRWAFARNPLFSDFTGIGGDCTNFVSQCLYAGGCQMNLTPVFGWYYISPEDRSAAFTGVEFFYNFMTTNEGVGPFAEETEAGLLLPGDVIELGREGEGYYHTLLIVGFEENDILVAAQTDNAFARPLSTYTYDYSRYIKILGVRLEAPSSEDCFQSVYDGVGLVTGE